MEVRYVKIVVAIKIIAFKRKGYALAVTKEYKAGDIVTCKVKGRPHIMIVSSKQTREGVPFIIHNIGGETREDDDLFTYFTLCMNYEPLKYIKV